MKKKIIASNRFQKNYIYYLTQSIGSHFHPNFKPEMTPKQMLEIGIFDGMYTSVTHDRGEFPKSWYTKAKIAGAKPDPQLNFFKMF